MTSPGHMPTRHHRHTVTNPDLPSIPRRARGLVTAARTGGIDAAAHLAADLRGPAARSIAAVLAHQLATTPTTPSTL